MLPEQAVSFMHMTHIEHALFLIAVNECVD